MSLGTGNPLGALIHADLHTDLSRAYPSTVTIQAATETQADDYSPVETWANVTGMTNIKGVLSPATAKEMRQAMMTNTVITHVCDLQAYYPAITQKHRVQAKRTDSDTVQTFNITGVKFDSQGKSTRLELEQVSH